MQNFLHSIQPSDGGFTKTNETQKQPPEVFCKKRCSKNFHKIHRKTPVPLKKKILVQVFSCEFCEISKNTFFKEYLREAASGNQSLRIFLSFSVN